MGRPRATIDLKAVENLAAIGCTQDDIAIIIQCSARTLRRRNDAKQAIETGSARLRTSIRRWQYEKAKDGNVAMLIWLGKQLLGQRDQIAQEIREETVIIEPIPKSGTDA